MVTTNDDGAANGVVQDRGWDSSPHTPADLTLQKVGGVKKAGWQPADFLKILSVMKRRDLILKDVAGRFEGMPPYDTALNWFRREPARHAKLIETIHQLSYRNQARSHCYSPHVAHQLRALRLRGMLQREIADLTGLSVTTIAKFL